MKKKEYIEKLKSLQGYGPEVDEEINHQLADDLLCQFLTQIGHSDIAEEFEKIGKWYA